MKPVLSVEQLTIETIADGQPLVQNISFQLAAGQIVGLVGESGCGKTVTSLALLRLLDEKVIRQSGRIWLDETDLMTLSDRTLRRVRGGQIAFIMQNPMSAFTPVFTIGHQLMETIRTHDRCSKREAKDRALEALREVNLEQPDRILKAYPFELSGGMLQRVMIALAVCLRPHVLIADEPTTALDVYNQKLVLYYLEKVRATYDTAILLISHDLSVIAEMADHVLVMRDGEIVEQANVFDLFDRPQHPYTRQLLAQHGVQAGGMKA
ncbi:ABC transporter ATP-binding protein [Exiguobacterium artemiae]|uniref:ABC transporter ATP-binding protein n=1 Tax=Exiguobacterium artemiae TaxID=340145 RepID=UPI002963D8E5|nr:ABC transporter ATP-binding protein [Exiguobacterium sibiricum]MDW2886576.1 ABC transporter ATP-binding protein [Exiguobacterium sibiricum]